MTQAELRERAPEGVPLTEYDREIAPIYLRLLDADAATEPGRAEVMHASHLARARWLRDGGYREFLGSTSS